MKNLNRFLNDEHALKINWYKIGKGSLYASIIAGMISVPIIYCNDTKSKNIEEFRVLTLESEFNNQISSLSNSIEELNRQVLKSTEIINSSKGRSFDSKVKNPYKYLLPEYMYTLSFDLKKDFIKVESMGNDSYLIQFARKATESQNLMNIVDLYEPELANQLRNISNKTLESAGVDDSEMGRG